MKVELTFSWRGTLYGPYEVDEFDELEGLDKEQVEANIVLYFDKGKWMCDCKKQKFAKIRGFEKFPAKGWGCGRKIKIHKVQLVNLEQF